MMNGYFPLYCDFRAGVDPRLAFTRVGSGTVFTPQGVWRELPGDTPRRTAPDGALLMGAGGTNAFRNPRWEGATLGVVGAGGALPTNMSFTGPATCEVVALGMLGDLRTITLDVTAAATGSNLISFEAASGIPMAASTTYTHSLLARLDAGSLSNVFCATRARVDAATAANGTTETLAGLTLGGPFQRIVGQYTTLADTTAGRYQLVWNSTGAAYTRLTFAAPQFQLGTFETNPILPPIGSPAASTIGADSAALLLRDFAIAPASAGLLLCAFRAAGGVGASAQPIASISDGTTDNRVLITRLTARTIRAEVFLAGVSQGSVTSVATVADNADAVAAVRFGAGDLALSLNGATVVTAIPAGMPAALTQMDLLGHGGATGRIGFRPRAGAAELNATLQTLSRQGPFA
jgi:hypothetical protein